MDTKKGNNMSNHFRQKGMPGRPFQVELTEAVQETKKAPAPGGNERVVSRKRRDCLIGAAVGAVGLVLGARGLGYASERKPMQSEKKRNIQKYIDQIAVEDVIMRERAARDFGRFAEMAACYHPDSVIDTSWFHGSGKEFAELTAKHFRGLDSPGFNFHEMLPPVVTVKNDRAIADAPFVLHGKSVLHECEVFITGYVRGQFRLLRKSEEWLIAGMTVFYIDDMIIPANPNRVPPIDMDKLNTFRHSYRYLSYYLSQIGMTPRVDLPGIDRPETVTNLLAREQEWLAKG
jgi:hypothetical protein